MDSQDSQEEVRVILMSGRQDIVQHLYLFALAFAVSRDFKNTSENIVSVIGDGALTGGMALEALNNIGYEQRKLIIILNDNQMSISKTSVP